MEGLLQGEKAKDVLRQLNDFMDGLVNKGFNLHTNNQQGYFRNDSYDWTVFKFYREGREYKLIMVEHKQHEGFCKEFLGISNKIQR